MSTVEQANPATDTVEAPESNGLGFDTLVSDPKRKLSDGEKQHVSKELGKIEDADLATLMAAVKGKRFDFAGLVRSENGKRETKVKPSTNGSAPKAKAYTGANRAPELGEGGTSIALFTRSGKKLTFVGLYGPAKLADKMKAENGEPYRARHAVRDAIAAGAVTGTETFVSIESRNIYQSTLEA